VSADPQQLLADFKAGCPVPLLEFLAHGIRAHEADLAKGAHRRKAVAASASPNGAVHMSLQGALAVGLKALEAASNRADSNRISDQERDEDCRQVVAALYRIREAYGEQQQTYKQKVEMLVGALGISGKRIKAALSQVSDVRPELIYGDSRIRGEDVILSCEGCDAVDDVCLLHGSPGALFGAARHDEPTCGLTRYLPEDDEVDERRGVGYLPKSGAAGMKGRGLLKALRFDVKVSDPKLGTSPAEHISAPRGALNRFGTPY
jgi:hypothetical protein